MSPRATRSHVESVEPAIVQKARTLPALRGHLLDVRDPRRALTPRTASGSRDSAAAGRGDDQRNAHDSTGECDAGDCALTSIHVGQVRKLGN